MILVYFELLNLLAVLHQQRTLFSGERLQLGNVLRLPVETGVSVGEFFFDPLPKRFLDFPLEFGKLNGAALGGLFFLTA
jgi:hypothetical protein